jgi:hypothetical protein
MPSVIHGEARLLINYADSSVRNLGEAAPAKYNLLDSRGSGESSRMEGFTITPRIIRGRVAF